MPADAAELVHAAERAHVRPVLDDDVPGEPTLLPRMTWFPMLQSCATWAYVISRLSLPMLVTRPPPCGAAMDRDEFADAVAAADAGFGALAFVFQVLRGHADGRVREKDVIFADPCRPFDDRYWPSGGCAAPISTSAPMMQ